MLMKRIVLRVVFAVILSTAAGRALAADRPNIIFIFTDDHASLAISAYGSKINKTPNIDRLANEGMRFDHCFCTNSLCGPSRAVIQSGKYSHVNGFYRNGNRFDGSQWTFPKELRKVGYQTAVIGKWHLESDPQGFDYWEVLIGQGPYYNPPMIRNGERVKHIGYTTEIITDLALDWLDKRDKSKPFMMMYQHKAPHRNWMPGPKYLTMYDDVTIPEPDSLRDNYAGRTSAAHEQAMMVARDLNANDLKLSQPGGLTPEQLEVWNAAYGPKNEAFKKANLTGDELLKWKYQRYIKDYLRCVAAVDDNIGRVLKYLDDNGLAKNTIVIYSSDQGWYLGEHGWFDKRWMYEESLHMPFIVKWPGAVKPGSVNTDMVSNVDFAPTFLDIAGANNPGDLHGRSLVPILKGQTPADWRKSFYYHYYEFPGAHNVAKHFGVRTERYKLIKYYQNKEWELFDLEKDPHEMRSVYDDPAYANVVKDMKAELTRLQDQLGENNPEQPVPGDPGTRPGNKKFEKGKQQSLYETEAGKVLGFDGKALGVQAKPDPSARPLAVSAWVNPSATPDAAVAIAQGGASFGFSLFLDKGKPAFVLRTSDELAQVTAKEAVSVNTWTHIAGTLDEEQTLHLYVNGKEVASGKGFAIESVPSDGLSIGGDTGSFVGEYGENNGFRGQLRDVRYFVGPVTNKEIVAWSAR